MQGDLLLKNACEKNKTKATCTEQERENILIKIILTIPL